MSRDILIVDDNPNNLKLLISILTEKAYRVRPATNGARALATIQKEKPDLILLDVMMPDMDGYEVCRQLKADPASREIPVIFISALDEVFDKVRAFEAGAVDFITKPIQEAEVLARIESQLLIQEQKHLLEQEIERRETLESIISQSRALLSTVLNVAMDGIMAFEAVRDDTGAICDFKWILVNSAAARLTGQSADFLNGRSLLEVMPFFKYLGIFSDYVAVIESGQPLDREFYFDELQIWIQMTAVRLGDGLAVTFRDTTRAKQIEQEFERLANLDGLTEIGNRRVFDQTLGREWKRCMRNRQPLALLLTDVDFFKRYNDTYGHVLGDACLIKVARAIAHVVRRPGDLVARYGGEEFAVILSETDLDGARIVAENICTAIRDLKIAHQSSDAAAQVTLSVGVASWTPTGEQEPEALLEAADTALYHSKEHGRNQVTIIEP
ncbi:MAG TPA: diguanylate cyclase [Candidatus Obscuribacterales bacterium]